MPNAGVCFKVLKKVKKALRHVVTKVSEFQSAKVFIKAKKALSKKSFIVLERFFFLVFLGLK